MNVYSIYHSIKKNNSKNPERFDQEALICQLAVTEMADEGLQVETFWVYELCLFMLR